MPSPPPAAAAARTPGGDPRPGLRKGLDGPVGVALAKAAARIPAEDSMPGGCLYEPKWDGFRMAAVRQGGPVRLWSRQGREMTTAFPEIAQALAAVLPLGTVVDGEVVIWSGDRTDFGLLQQRLASGTARVRRLRALHPASFVVFDVLAAEGADKRRLPFAQRRALLERMAQAWSPPLEVCPQTDDRAQAQEWFTQFRVAGLEGIVVKAAGGRYRPAVRDWVKVKSYTSTEAIIGGVLGTLARPHTVVVGRYRDDGVLRIVGRSTPLTRDQSLTVAAAITPARADHPWPERIGSGAWGASRLSVPVIRVDPSIVAEIAADAAVRDGAYRHPVRFVRLRPDLQAHDVDPLRDD